MSHRVHPYSFRVGIIRDWKSRWFDLKNFPKLLKEDVRTREWLLKKLRPAMISDVEIERSRNTVNFIIKTPRPGLIIGRSGEGIEMLKRELQKKIGIKEFKVSVEEVRNPQGDSRVVARQVVQDLEKRLPFRRTLKQTIEKVAHATGVEGVKIHLSGRLDGSEMGRSEWLRRGRIPLQTLRADIDYARDTAYLPYGTIGVRVWIYKGQIFKGEK